MRENSASESEKRTQIGSPRVSVVRSAESAFGATRLPTDCSARPVMPAIGALTVGVGQVELGLAHARLRDLHRAALWLQRRRPPGRPPSG